MKAIRYDLDTMPLNGLVEEITVTLPYYDEDFNLTYLNRNVILKAEIINHSPETARLIRLYEALRQKVWGAADDYLTAYRELGCQGDSGRRFYGISGWDTESRSLVLFDYGWQGGAFNKTEKYCCLPYYYSHFLAVDREVPEIINGKPVLLNYRSSGLGVKAKLFIDKIVEREGLFANVWTVNPLLGANASMNFGQYGADVLLFDPNHYGPMTGFNVGLRTDRFVMIKPQDYRARDVNLEIKEKVVEAVRESVAETDPRKRKINRLIINPMEYVPLSLNGEKPERFFKGRIPDQKRLYQFFFENEVYEKVCSNEEVKRCRSLLKNVDEDLFPENPKNNHLVKKICALPLGRDDDYLIMQIPEDFENDYRLNPALARENQLLFAILLNRYVKELNYGVSFISVKNSSHDSRPGEKTERFNFYILEKGKGLCSFKDLPWRPPGTAAFIKNQLKQMGIGNS